MPVGILHLYVRFSGNKSLKEKRGQLLPILQRLRKEFNVSVVEMELQDRWNESVIACAGISNSREMIYRELQNVASFIPKYYPNVQLVDEKIEIF